MPLTYHLLIPIIANLNIDTISFAIFHPIFSSYRWNELTSLLCFTRAINTLNQHYCIAIFITHDCRRVPTMLWGSLLYLWECPIILGGGLRWGVLRCRARVVGNGDKWWLALLCRGILKVKCVSDSGWCIGGIVTRLQKGSDYSS